MEKVLLLGGTREARLIADLLAMRPGCDAILSLAGVTASPSNTGLPNTKLRQRVGGFGGAAKMAEWMQAEAITTLIDATHPYAEQISAHAVVAAEMARVRRLGLWRPPWQPEGGDRWQHYDNWQALIVALPHGARVMLTAGQDAIRAFAGRAFADEDRVTVVARALKQPEAQSGITFIEGLPKEHWQDEAALLKAHGITHLVAKNSGGTSSRAKLVAARHLGLPVLLLARPSPPPPPLFDNIESLMQAF